MMLSGVGLNRGDLIHLRCRAIPLPEFPAAVIRMHDDELEVLSTFLVPFGHNGVFPVADIECLALVHPAAQAIPAESRGFVEHEIVSAEIGEYRQYGRVIAAFDGIVVAEREDGELITGGAMHFERAGGVETVGT